MAEAGIAFGAVGTLNLIIQRFSNLKIRCKDFALLPEHCNVSFQSFENCRKSVIRMKTLLEGDHDLFGKRAADVLRTILDRVDASLTKGERIVKSIEDEFIRANSEATASESSHVAGNSCDQGHPSLIGRNRLVGGRLVKEGKVFSRADKLKTKLEELDVIWREAQPAIDRVIIALIIPSVTENHLISSDICKQVQSALEHIATDLSTIRENHGPSPDKYLAHFDMPLLPNKVVLNFSGDTMEARLKRAVLWGTTGKRVTAAVGRSLMGAVAATSQSQVGVVGMGGVGKTVALKGLCSEPELRSQYVDGVFFISLGQDAAEKDVVAGLAHFVKSSGGVSLSVDIKQESSAKFAARQASLWFRGKCALFVCDDIWSFEGHPIGYLSSLKGLLCNSRSSAMVISTREKSIANDFHDVEFSPREVRGEQASRILAGYADVDIEAVRELSDDWAAFQEILDVCAGLPVALAAAGTGVRNVIKERRGSIVRSVVIYANELKISSDIVRHETVDEYHGLNAVVETSLQHCEKWARSTEGRKILRCALSAREKFEALSVLRKQGWIPRASLERLWETDERVTQKLMCKFSDMHLVSRRWMVTPIGEVDGLELHDLVLQQAKTLSKENNRASLWHARLLDGYIRKAGDDMQPSNTNNHRDWWDCAKVPDDGYIEKNVARHLAMSEGNELELLLSDVRWSKRRMKFGGIVALRNDFEELSCVSGRIIGSEAVRSALEESWVKITKNIHETPFELYGRLQSHLPSSEFVQRLLSSVSKQIPKPHFVPKQDVRWRAHSGELMRIDFEKHIKALCFGKDQNIIAVAQGHEIHVFDLLAKCNICTLQGHEGEIISVAMSGDGSRIVSGSWDMTVRVWDGHSGQYVLRPLLGHDRDVSCVSISGDGSRIVSGSDDNTLRVWDGQSGKCVLGPLVGHEGTVSCVAMSVDGSRIVTGSDDNTLRVWDGQSGQCVLGPLLGHETWVSCVAISVDGSRIVSGSWDLTVRMWDGQSGQCVLGPLRGHERDVSCVAMSGDGNHIVSGSRDRTVRVWDGQSGQCVLGPLAGHKRAVSCVTMSGDGNHFVSGSRDHTIRVWDGQSGQCVLGPLLGHEGTVSCVAMNVDGSRIVSGSRDRTVRVWDGQSGQCVLGPLLGHERAVSCVARSVDGSRVVSGSRDHTVRVWDGQSGQCDLRPLLGHEGTVSCIAVSGDGSRIVSGSDDNTLRVWDGHSGQCVLGPLLGHERAVSCVAMSGDGSRIISGSWDYTVRLWDHITGLPKCEVLQLGERIESLEFDGGSDVCIVCTSADAFLYNTSNETEVHRSGYIFTGIKGGIYAAVENGKPVQVATVPSPCAAFCYNLLHSKAAVGLRNGQVIIGELVL